MKVLHTADWHLNERLGPQDRSEDLRRALRQIAGYLDEHSVDVMVVAGDVFCDRSRPEQLQRAVRDIRDTFLPFLSRGGTMVAISGNHDSEVFFETLRLALDLVAPGRPSSEGHAATGRLYVAARPRVLRLAGPNGQAVQFALMPYPTSAYLRGDDPTRFASLEEKHLKIRERFLGTLDAIKQQEIDPRLPSVLVSHAHVRGAQVHSLYHVSEAEDVMLEPADLPAHWAYVAYGHIHRPQLALAGAANARYAGSIERLDIGEAEDEKSVVLAELVRSGLAQEPVALPLRSTPIYRVSIDDPDTDLPGLRRRYPDAAEALVQYTLHWDPARHDRDALTAAIQEIFPRWYRRDYVAVGRAAVGASGAAAQGADLTNVPATVRSYLGQRLATHPERDAILVLAEALLAGAAGGAAEVVG